MPRTQRTVVDQIAPAALNVLASTARHRAPWWAPWAVAGATMAATAAITAADPAANSVSLCPLRALTGLACPLCGGLRATAALAHGQVGDALAMNPLWVLLVAPLVGWWAWWLWRTVRRRPGPAMSARAWWTWGVLLLAFGVLRNVPALVGVLGPVP